MSCKQYFVFFLIVEDIRKCITSNYKNILDEMQTTLANETLSKCIGNVDHVRNKISQLNRSRQQRMNDFLRFVIQHDHNVIEFVRVLKNNGLEDLLRLNPDVHRENFPVQGIGKLSKQNRALHGKYYVSCTIEFRNKVIVFWITHVEKKNVLNVGVLFM